MTSDVLRDVKASTRDWPKFWPWPHNNGLDLWPQPWGQSFGFSLDGLALLSSIWLHLISLDVLGLVLDVLHESLALILMVWTLEQLDNFRTDQTGLLGSPHSRFHRPSQQHFPSVAYDPDLQTWSRQSPDEPPVYHISWSWSFSSKIIIRTHRHTHQTDCSTWSTKVVGTYRNTKVVHTN